MKRDERKRRRRTHSEHSREMSDASEKNPQPSVSTEAMRGVVAIFAIAVAIFLVVAEVGGGGFVGVHVYESLSWLFGIGYTLVPISLFLLAVVIFRSFEKRFGWIHLVSLVVFLVAGMGLINVAFNDRGGVLGAAVSNPLLSSVDTTATVIFLLAFIIAALIVAFDVHLDALMKSLRTRLLALRASAPDDETALDHVAVTGLPPEDHEDAPSTSSDTAAEKSPANDAVTTKKSPAIASFFKGDTLVDGFPIVATLGEAYVPPPVSILSKNKGKPEVGDVKANMNIIKRTLQNFGIQVEMDEASIGPTVTRYSMKPAEGVRLSKILTLQSNLELALAVSPVRIEAPIPGKSLVGIEVPNMTRTTLGLAPLVTDEKFISSEKPLLVSLGRSITGTPEFVDLAKMPHMLVAGTTGAGKSVTMNNFIVSLLYRCGPERLRFIMVDPKRVELTLYNSIPHLLTPVITDAKKAILALKWLAKEMDRRYNILEGEKVRDIASYHSNIVAPAVAKAMAGKPASGTQEKLPEAMPYIVVVVDELADIMQAYPRELESGIVRLAQMSRAVGIHLILSTQRPSVKVITGLIKANVPARLALQVASQIDSRTILDMGGAEKLLGAGDMLFLSGEMSKPRRIQAAYISETEVKEVVRYLAKQSEGILPDEIDFTDTKMSNGTDAIFSSMIGGTMGDEEDDELYNEAKQTIIEAGKASTSYLQRKLGVGYARAARLMDLLEDRGVIGPADGAKPRSIIGDGNADELAHTPIGVEDDVAEDLGA
ncbi:MAG TPA: DNA translocase FtsK 4TM domain-containing protein [Candidatus Paceibacterota bacterium]|nr:DNA translocase FtsK 4TM domain-containing protein [Candidatus Paceibacterota bacterium]